MTAAGNTPVCPVCQNPGCCCSCFGKTPRKDCPHIPPRCTPKRDAGEFVDGRGEHWLSTGRTDTDGYDLLASIDAPETVESTESILQRTGSLREIGRCV